MPIIAVVAAVVAVSEAVAVTATVFEIITAVGAVASAVGAVTGNKNLMKIGGVIGLAGGIGMLADSAGLFGSAASVGDSVGASGGVIGAETNAGAMGATGPFGDGAIAAENAAVATAAPIDAGAAMVGDGAPALAEPIAATTSAPGTINALPTTLPDAAPTTLPDAEPTWGSPNAGAITSVNPAAPSSVAPISTNPVSTNLMPTGVGNSTESAIDSNFLSGGRGIAPAPSGSAQNSSWFDKAADAFKSVSGFADQNKTAASMIMQGISSWQDPSARNVREAQARGLNANAGYTEQETKNMNGVGGAIQWGINPASLNKIKPPGNFRTGT